MVHCIVRTIRPSKCILKKSQSGAPCVRHKATRHRHGHRIQYYGLTDPVRHNTIPFFSLRLPLLSPSVRAALQVRPAWLRNRGFAGRNRGAPAVSETLRRQRATCRSLSGLAASVVLYRLPV